MNELSARRYFSRTGMVFVVDKITVNNTTTIRIKKYEDIEPALRYVKHSENAEFVNLTHAKKMGWVHEN